MSALELVAQVARQLNAGAPVDATLAGVARSVREGLGADRAIIWWQDDAVAGFRAAADPPLPAAMAIVAALDRIPDEGVRLPIRPAHAPSRMALLQVVGTATTDSPLPELIADLLAGYISSAQLMDEHARAAAERARATDQAHRFNDLVIDSLPVGLYIVDREYRIQVWNRNREIGTQGLRRGEVVGRTVFEVLTRQPPEQLRSEFDRIFETGELRQTDMDVETPRGTRSYRLTRIPMRLDGDTITHVITIGEDVSDWRDVQVRILQSEKLAAIGQLAAGVMHEINNPLATIAACVAAGEGRLPEVEGPGEPALREYLSIIDREVQRCTNIVDGLLDFSRPKGKTKGAADINRIVEETLGLLRHHKRFKSVTLVREMDPGLPEVVANAEQIVQVLMALMINALEAMETGGRLVVRTLKGRRMDEVLVEVEDTGPGIAAGERTKIFEPFYTTKPQGRGTGLGLSICYGIVEEHRGRIEVDSQSGRGATFRVVLPAGGTT